ncbi:BlaI/MecI/CopY family transcriptional regulator [bacterium]|nr:BlaI/MecI/CopY family transcriptional regulator [bacterium]
MLTETELELMSILWKLGEGTVSDVQRLLPQERALAYTSISTILRILEQKKVVKTRKEGRGHIYIPLLKKEAYEARAVRHVVDRVFDGAPVGLVRQLLTSVKLKEKEWEQIKALIEGAEERT